MALNLLKSGYKLTIWNRTTSACQPLVNAGATLAASPAEVCASSQVTFAMVSTPEAALLCAEAALSGLGPGKGYVDFTTMDAKTSRDIFTKVRSTGAQYLEAPVSGSKGPAEQGNLIFLVSSFHTYSGRRHVTGGPSFPFVSIFLSSPYKVLEATDAVRRFLQVYSLCNVPYFLAAGDEELYCSVTEPLETMGKAHFFLGEVGAGSKMKLVLNAIMGSMMASFAEGLVLAEKADLDQEKVLEVISLGAISTPMYSLKGSNMIKGAYPTSFPLKHQQKDLRLALALGDELAQEMPVAAAANELYKAARRVGMDDQDFSAVITALGKRSIS